MSVPYCTSLVERKEGEREKRGETHRLVGFLTPQYSINASFLYGELYTHIHIHSLAVRQLPRFPASRVPGDEVRGADDNAQCLFTS
jgi:hypothetical protein